MATAAPRSSIRDLIVRYGKVGVGVHIVLSACWFGTCYALVSSNVDVEGVLNRVGIKLGETGEPAEVQPQSAPSPTSIELSTSQGGSLAAGAVGGGGGERIGEDALVSPSSAGLSGASTTKGLANSGGSLLLTFLAYKALMPVRLPVTFAVTPVVARWLRR